MMITARYNQSTWNLKNTRLMLHLSNAESDVTVDSVLLQNCRPGWPDWTCMVSNTCGLISTALWFIVLLPQVWKNFRRKSVMGLSALWATANFTASLTNLFFVYMYAKIPLYGKINSIYMPILEFTILIQFWIYGDHYGRKAKTAYTAFCFTLWSTIIGLQLGLRRFEDMQWLAITLWCVETFPQIILNLKLRSTSGQSTTSVAIGIFGKTTDFVSNYGLVIPLQYVIMTYFSSSVAFVNGIQVAWYYQDNNVKNLRKHSSSRNVNYTDKANPDEAGYYDETEALHKQADISVGYDELLHRYHQCRFIRRVIILVLSSILVIFTAGLLWNTRSMYALFGPLTIMSVVGVSHVYYRTKYRVRRYVPIN